MAERRISTRMAIEGESEYTAKVRAINSELGKLDSALRLTESQFRNQANSLEALTEKSSRLADLEQEQSEKVALLDEAYKNAQSALAEYTSNKEKLTAEIEKNERALEELQKAGSDTSEQEKKLTEEIVRQKTELEKNEAALDAAQRGSNEWEKKLNSAKIKQNDLNAEIERNSKYLDEAKNSTDGCATSIDQYGKTVKNASDNTEQFSDETIKAFEAIAAVMVASGVKKSFEEIVELLKDASSAARDFESAMAGVDKTSNLTKEELKAMGDEFLEMSTKIPVTAEKFAAFAELGGQLGVAKENLADFSKVIAMLETSTDMTGESASMMLAQLRAIVDFDESEYINVGSAVVELGNNFATTESKVVEMTQGIAATAKIANMSLSDMIAISTAVSSLGIESANGSTQISKLISSLDMAVATGDNLEEFASVAGMSAQEFSQAWGVDAAGAMNEFIKGLNDTERNGASATAVLNNLGITETRMLRVILSLAESEDLLGKALVTSGEAYKANNALTEEAAKRYATLDSKAQMYENSVNALQIVVGDKLNVALAKFYDIGSDVTQWAAEFVEENEWIVAVLGALAAALGVATVALAGFTILPKITKMVQLFTAALAANPIGMVAVALAAVIAACTAMAALLPPLESETLDLADGTSQLAESLRVSREEMERANEEIKEKTENTEQLVTALDALIGRENQSAAEQEQVLAIVEMLNEAVPGLALSYDKETNSINKSTAAIKNMIAANADIEKSNLAAIQLSQLYADAALAEENLLKVTEELEEAQTRLNDAQSTFSIQSSGAAALEQAQAYELARKEVNALEESQQELTEEYDFTIEAMRALEEELGITAEMNAETADSARALEAEIGNISISLATLEASYNSAYQSAYEAIDGQIGLFDTLSVSSSMSIDSLIASLDSQIIFMDEYAANIQKAMEMGVDQGLVSKLSDGSEQSAQILAAIVQGGEADIELLNEKLGGVEEGKEQFATTVALMETDFDNSMSEIEKRLEESMEELNKMEEAAEAGSDTIQGYINGANTRWNDVYSAFSSLAEAANSGWKETLDQHSPSKRMERDAEDTVEGAIIGAYNKEQELREAFENLAEASAGAYTVDIQKAETAFNNVRSVNNNKIEIHVTTNGLTDAEIYKIADILNRVLGDQTA